MRIRYYLRDIKFMDDVALTVMYRDFVWWNRRGAGTPVYRGCWLELWNRFTTVFSHSDVVSGKWQFRRCWFSVNQCTGVTWSLKVHDYFLCCKHRNSQYSINLQFNNVEGERNHKEKKFNSDNHYYEKLILGNYFSTKSVINVARATDKFEKIQMIQYSCVR